MIEYYEFLFHPLFPFLFAGIWCSVCFLFALFSGWRTLARDFAYDANLNGPFEGLLLKGQSGTMSGARKVLHIGTNDNGLYLSNSLVFRMFHKPLLIPWQYVKATPNKGFSGNTYRLTFASIDHVYLDISEKTLKKANISGTDG